MQLAFYAHFYLLEYIRIVAVVYGFVFMQKSAPFGRCMQSEYAYYTRIYIQHFHKGLLRIVWEWEHYTQWSCDVENRTTLHSTAEYFNDIWDREG